MNGDIEYYDYDDDDEESIHINNRKSCFHSCRLWRQVMVIIYSLS
jgi:hypothetical protein